MIFFLFLLFHRVMGPDDIEKGSVKHPAEGSYSKATTGGAAAARIQSTSATSPYKPPAEEVAQGIHVVNPGKEMDQFQAQTQQQSSAMVDQHPASLCNKETQV